jgi:hypothetical protein
MPTARCPRCDAAVRVEDEDWGYDVECPACGAVFAAGPAGGPPHARRHDDRPSPGRTGNGPEELIAEARRAVFLPGLFTVLVCVAGMGYQLLDLAAVLAMPQLLNNNPLMRGVNIPLEVYVLFRVLAIAWEGVILAGASAMMRGRAYGFARAAMTMRVIPFFGCCFIPGAAFGIWGIVALNRPEVRAGFEEARREREQGGRETRERDHRGYDGDEGR